MSTKPQQSQVQTLHLEPTFTLDTVDDHSQGISATHSTADYQHSSSELEESYDATDSSSEKSDLALDRSLIEKNFSPSRAWCYRFFILTESWQARAFYIFSHILLLLMVVSFCLETVPSVYQTESNEWIKFSKSLDISLLVVLTGEFLGKFYGWPCRRKFLLNYKNLLDFITIIPFFVVTFFEAASSSYFFRVLRLLKVFTLLKIFRVNQYSPGIYVTTRAIRNSLAQIAIVSLYLLVAILISSSLIFFVEQGEYDKINRVWMRNVDGQWSPSPFQSILHSFYWSIVTLTTTGYGDIVPVTPLGKLVTGFTVMCGVMVIALPTSIIGSNLVSEWENYRRVKFQMEFKHSKTIHGAPLPRLPRERKEKIKVLRRHNKLMINLISEIQEKLYDINPPHFYMSYKRLSIKYLQVKQKVSSLEAELEKYKKLAQNSGDSEHGVSSKPSFLQPFRKFRTENSARDDHSPTSTHKTRKKKLLHSLLPGTEDHFGYGKRLSTDMISGPFSPRPIHQETLPDEAESNGEPSGSQEISFVSEPESLTGTFDSKRKAKKRRNKHHPLQYSRTDHSIDYSKDQSYQPKHIDKHVISRPFAPRLYSNYAASKESSTIPDTSNSHVALEISLTSPSPISDQSTIDQTMDPEHQSITIDPPPISFSVNPTVTENNDSIHDDSEFVKKEQARLLEK